MRARHLAARGLGVGIQLPLSSSWSVGARWSFLNGVDFQEGQLRGRVAELSRNDYQGLATVDYHYSRDYLFDHQFDDPRGRGHALDLRLSWQSGPWSAQIKAEDLWMQMTWYDAPFTRGLINTDRVEYNEEGFPRYQAVLRGRRGLSSQYETSLPTWTEAQLSYQAERWGITAQLIEYAGLAFPGARLHLRSAHQRHQWEAGYEGLSERVDLGYQYQGRHLHWGALLGTNKWSLRYAHALRIDLQLGYQF